jgi:hypothetical protein
MLRIFRPRRNNKTPSPLEGEGGAPARKHYARTGVPGEEETDQVGCTYLSLGPCIARKLAPTLACPRGVLVEKGLRSGWKNLESL